MTNIEAKIASRLEGLTQDSGVPPSDTESRNPIIVDSVTFQNTQWPISDPLHTREVTSSNLVDGTKFSLQIIADKEEPSPAQKSMTVFWCKLIGCALR